MKKISTLLLVLVFSISVQSQMRYFYGVLSSANEVPPNSSTASGIVVVRYNMTTKFIQLFGNYNSLTSAVTGSHIHLGAAGTNGSVIVNLPNTGGTSGTMSGSGTLTTAQETELLAGNTYANVHSSTYPGGEIRSQLIPTTDGQTEFLNARLQGAQEIPPNNSTATGFANVLVDKATNKVYLTGMYSGLTSNITGSHIHLGGYGVNGSVILTLVNSGSTTGTIHGEGTFTATQTAAAVSAGTYVNVHSSTYTGGEIRGQLTSYSQQRFFAGQLSGANEVPPNSSTATGVVIARYNTETNEIELTGNYQALSASVTGAHIHVGSPGINGPVIITLTNSGGTTGTLTGTGTITEPQEDSLLNGKLYVNVHSGTYPGGEIRTQLMPASSGEAQFLKGALQGSQEVPANSSTATGTATVMLDKLTRQVYVTGNFSGLSSNISGSHIHRGEVGVNGPVIVPLTFSGTTSGTFSGMQTLNANQVDSMINGFTYINVHSVSLPAGEIRSQLGDLVLPVKLGYFNGYRERNKIVLKWQALNEDKLLSYTIEQLNTTNGRWISKSVVAARRGSGPETYRVEDIPNNYNHSFVNYRLSMLDINGRTEFSPVIKLRLDKTGAALTILSNPISSNINFSVTGVDGKMEVSIIDQQGRKVFYQQNTPAGMQRINTSGFANGIYTLVIASGSEQLQQQFIKQ